MKLWCSAFLFAELAIPLASADILVPGANFGNLDGTYYIAFDNGLDVDDEQFFFASIPLELAAGGPSSGVLQSGAGGSLTPGHMWYAVAVGQVLDPAFVQNSPTAFAVAFEPDYAHVAEEPLQVSVSEPFYLGVWIAQGRFAVPSSGDVFGWAELVYDGTSLRLLDSAAENARPGIFVGRYEAVPEPSSVLLFAFGAMSLYRRLRPH